MLRKLFFGVLILYCALLVQGTHCVAQTTQTVTIAGHSFTPGTTAINVGDQVTWVWDATYHDVTSGTAGTANGVFGSGLQLTTGVTYSVTFDRNFLRANATTVAPDGNGNYSFNYFCTPHYLMGMTGIVNVTAQPVTFSAAVQSAQVVPPTSSSATGQFSLTLSPNESQLVISGTHSVASAQIDLIRAPAGTNGSTAITTFSGADGTVNQTISFTPALADDLYAGNLYLQVRSSDFPNGAIRGQIVLSDVTTRTISGQVLNSQHVGVQNVLISNGVQSTLTDASGSYALSGVANGFYQLTATLAGSTITANDGTNPVLVDSADTAARDFTLQDVMVAPVLTFITPADGSVLTSYDVDVTLSERDPTAVTYTLDGKAGAQAVNGNSFALTLKNGSHSLQLATGDPLVTIAHSFTVRSALTSASLNKALLLNATIRRAPTISSATKLFTLLSKMDAGGTVNPTNTKLKKAKVDKALALATQLKRKLSNAPNPKKLSPRLRATIGSICVRLNTALRAMI